MGGRGMKDVGGAVLAAFTACAFLFLASAARACRTRLHSASLVGGSSRYVSSGRSGGGEPPVSAGNATQSAAAHAAACLALTSAKTSIASQSLGKGKRGI